MRNFFKIYILLCCLIQPFSAIAQTTAIDSLEKEILRLETENQKLSVERATLNLQASGLAEEITSLKGNTEMNFLQRRRLEGQLQSSQELAARIETLDLSILRNQKRIAENSRSLIGFYNQSIDQTLNYLLKNKKLKPSEKTKSYLRIVALKQKRDQLLSKYGNLAPELRNPLTIQIDENDTPRQISQKADWLKDQEDKLRKEAEVITRQIRNYEDEIDIREKMNDLEQEISLFNHRDENLTHVSLVQEPAAKDVLYFDDDGDRNGLDDTYENSVPPMDVQPSKNSPIIISQQLSGDKNTLTEVNIDTLIQSLKNQQNQLVNQADSLQKKAAEFYKRAKQLKQQD